jgi:hypothetical protein
MSAFSRQQSYVGREAQKALLREWAAAVAADGGCRALYVEATGGLGKTRLLQCLPEIIAASCPGARVAPIVDLYDFEHRSAEAIERRLIDGLAARSPADRHLVPPARVAAAFADYHRVAAETLADRQLGDPDSRRAYGLSLRAAFVAGWNDLAAESPLVLRFDTLEALLASPAPPAALASVGRALTERELVSGWMREVLPRLRRTLVLLSGRPPAAGVHPLVAQIEALGLLAAPPQRIEPLAADDEIRAYLRGHGLELTAAEVAEVRRLTDGRPLLLTSWAAARHAAPPLRPPPGLASRAAFEDWLVDSILDPLAPLSPADRTLAYCLYALSYARRGLRPRELAALLARLGLDHEPAALALVGDLALVKAVDGPDGEPLLFLHDEACQLIDLSGRPEDLGLREPALAFLCALARGQVEAAADRISLLRAMANHMSYELRRDPAGGGYASYAVYAERLLREHCIEEALILSDVFWATLTARAPREGRMATPGLDALREAALPYDTIVCDEEVRAIWLLHAQELHPLAVDEAERLIARLAGDGAPAHETRTELSLALAWSVAATRARPPEDHDLIALRCTRAIAALEAVDEGCPDYLLRVRRDALIGQAYLTRGQVRLLQLRFPEARADAAAADRAFRRHLARADGAPHDPIAYNLAAVSGLYVALLALDGDLDEALRYSAEMLAAHLAQPSQYHRALYACQHAALLLRRGDDAGVDELLAQADQAAVASGSKRARGLVAHCRGLRGHRLMLAAGAPDPAVDRFFAEAAALLHHEPGPRLDVCRDWAAYDIDLAALYAAEGGELAARRHRLLAADLLDEHLSRASELPPLHAAELLTLKAAIVSPEVAAGLLAAAEERLTPPLPALAHVIWGRIAIQRARRTAEDATGAGAATARDQYALALAHMLAFAPRHADLAPARRAARQWAAVLPPELRAALAAGLADAPPPAPAASPRGPAHWERAWQAACAEMRE